MNRLLLATLLLVFSTQTFAGGAYDVSVLDKSVTYLGEVFGQMGTVLVGDGNSLFAELIQIMNTIIFTLGIIIITYAGAMSTIQTAQEGEVMGKKWSTIWVPVRAGLGLFLLLPSPGTGYSYIQIVVMYFITQGIGGANALWGRVVDGMAQGETLQQKVEPVSEIQNQNASIANLLESELCRAAINDNPLYLELLQDEPITVFRWGDRIIWGTESNNKAICGAVSIPNFSNIISRAQAVIGGTTELDNTPLKNIFYQMILSASFSLENVALEALTEPEVINRTAVANLADVSRVLKRNMQDITDYYSNLVATEDLYSIAKADGWIHAGSFYFMMVTGVAQAETPPIITIPHTKPNLDFLTKTAKSTLEAKIDSEVDKTFDAATMLFGKKPTRDQLGQGLPISSSSAASGTVKGWDATLGKFFKEIAFEIMDVIAHGDETRDPLISISKFGQKIMQIVEVTFYITIGVLALIAIGTVMSCSNPLWGIITTISFILISLFMIVGSLLYPAGVIMGLYVPLIPWLVFTFSAIGWILLVIEAIVAAPLIALVLVVPSEDEMGKAGHSLVILLGLLFRPALMIIGFVAGGKVMFVTVGMLDFGFREMVLANIHGLGVFGAIALIVVYVGVIITIIHQCFSLIYLIPDKVLRWMGGQPEQQDVMGKVQEIKGSAQKGGAVSWGAMKGITASASNKVGGMKGG